MSDEPSPAHTVYRSLVGTFDDESQILVQEWQAAGQITHCTAALRPHPTAVWGRPVRLQRVD